MKTYLISFRNKETNTLIDEVKVNMDEKSVDKSTGILVLSALETMKREGRKLPDIKNCSWSYTIQ